jgi:hypothetical protein
VDDSWLVVVAGMNDVALGWVGWAGRPAEAGAKPQTLQ